jgi:ferredoxin
MKDVLDKHKAQAISYSMLMQIPDVLFLYVDRDLYNKKTFLYTPSAQEKGKWLNNINYGLECVNCGSCSFSCQAGRPLAALVNQGRQTVLAAKRKARK